MTPFTYATAGDAVEAVRLGIGQGAAYLGGGTNLVDLMRETVARPQALVDVSRLSQAIEPSPDGGLMIGAAVRNTALAQDRTIRTRYPMIARAILAGASAQIRNMATVGGNVMQRTRCAYFYDTDGSRCNKREQGSGCDARDGLNRTHAVLGASPDCVATHPSDLCVALVAHDAVVHLHGSGGMRTVPFVDFHRLPGDRPEIDTVLDKGELITAIELPPLAFGANAMYRKVRDRASYAFALVSVGAAIQIDDGMITDVRIALGGVAHKPWRALTAEAALRGRPANLQTFDNAAAAELADARPLRDNAFKIELVRRTLIAVLGDIAKGAA